MYAELEVHRTMIRDRVRTEAFRRAIESVVRPGDVVLDVGAGSGILSLFAARAGAARVYAVERTTVAALAQRLAAANGVAEVVQVFHGDVMEVKLPGRVDVIVSEWLGGFGIDEGMLVPVIAARDRWLKPGGVMIPRLVTAWTALVEDRYSGDMVGFLRDNPYGFKLDDLAEMTVNEIFYSGTFRHLAAGDRRSEPGRLWTTDAESIPLEQAQAPHEAETPLPVSDHGMANALALWFSAELAPGISLSVGPGDPPTHWGMTTAPLRWPVELTPGMVVRARVRTAAARPAGTWTSWAVALPGAGWEEHDEQAVWQEIDDLPIPGILPGEASEIRDRVGRRASGLVRARRPAPRCRCRRSARCSSGLASPAPPSALPRPTNWPRRAAGHAAGPAAARPGR
jgi:type I protein arginine methyltransferase